MKTPSQSGSMVAVIAAVRTSAGQIARWLAGGLHRPLLVLALAVMAAFFIPPLMPDEARSDDVELPTIPMVELDGAESTTDAWRGTPFVINIWATWCPPCREEMPSLERLGERLAADGIRVFALSVDEDQHLVREFMIRYGIDLPIGIAATPSEAMSALGVAGIPLTLYVDASGRIVGRYIGERDWADEAVVQEVREKLLR